MARERARIVRAGLPQGSAEVGGGCSLLCRRSRVQSRPIAISQLAAALPSRSKDGSPGKVRAAACEPRRTNRRKELVHVFLELALILIGVGLASMGVYWGGMTDSRTSWVAIGVSSLALLGITVFGYADSISVWKP